MLISTTESSRDQAPATATPAQSQRPAGVEEESHQPWSFVSTNSNIPALLSPPRHRGHLNHLQKVTVRCKASAKRKVTLSVSFLKESCEKKIIQMIPQSATIVSDAFLSTVLKCTVNVCWFENNHEAIFVFRWRRWKWMTSMTASNASTTKTPPPLSRKGLYLEWGW